MGNSRQIVNILQSNSKVKRDITMSKFFINSYQKWFACGYTNIIIKIASQLKRTQNRSYYFIKISIQRVWNFGKKNYM